MFTENPYVLHFPLPPLATLSNPKSKDVLESKSTNPEVSDRGNENPFEPDWEFV